MKWFSCLAIVFVLGASVHLAQASGPIAVYALIDKVALEPNASQPQTIRIDGVFSVSVNTGGSYSPPQRGYVYLSSAGQRAEDVQREWKELQAAAGTHQVVGFGSGWAGSVRIRRPEEKENAPDNYSVNVGVVRLNADHPRARPLLEFKDR